MVNEPFSTYQFFEDGSYECVRQHVELEKAMEGFRFYSNNLTADMGIVKRVIVTDAGDCIVAEWIYGKGIVFPTPEQIAEAKTK